MNIRARLSNACTWGTIGAAAIFGVATSVIGGLISYYHNACSGTSIYADAIKSGCAKYGCSYDAPEGGLGPRPFCHTDDYPFHDLLLEGRITGEAEAICQPYDNINKSNSISFALKCLLPIGIAGGLVLGFLYGFCKTPERTSQIGLFGCCNRRESVTPNTPLLPRLSPAPV